MPKYGVYVTMVRTCVIEIEADNAKEAVKKVLAGEGEEFDSFGEEIVPPATSVRSSTGYVLARSVEDAVSQIKAFIEGARP